MERTEIMLIIILIISLLSLWFSFKTYERKMRRYQHRRCSCGYFSEGYSGGERSGAARARAAIQDRERGINEQGEKNISYPRPQPIPPPGCLDNPCLCYPDSPYC